MTTIKHQTNVISTNLCLKQLETRYVDVDESANARLSLTSNSDKISKLPLQMNKIQTMCLTHRLYAYLKLVLNKC